MILGLGLWDTAFLRVQFFLFSSFDIGFFPPPTKLFIFTGRGSFALEFL